MLLLIEEIAYLFKAMGEPTRLKILKLLSIQEMCVCELVEVLDISQPRVSQHLKVLKNAGVFKERKDKQRTFLASHHQKMIVFFIYLIHL